MSLLTISLIDEQSQQRFEFLFLTKENTGKKTLSGKNGF